MALLLAALLVLLTALLAVRLPAWASALLLGLLAGSGYALGVRSEALPAGALLLLGALAAPASTWARGGGSGPSGGPQARSAPPRRGPRPSGRPSPSGTRSWRRWASGGWPPSTRPRTGRRAAWWP